MGSIRSRRGARALFRGGRTPAFLTTALVASVLVPAGAAQADSGPTGPLGDLVATSVALTDTTVYASTADGIVASSRTGADHSWVPVVTADGVLTGRLLQAESDVLLVASNPDTDTLAWRAGAGAVQTRTVPAGTVLGAGGRYVLLPATLVVWDATWVVQDVRTGATVDQEAVPDAWGAAVVGSNLWFSTGTSPTLGERDLTTGELVPSSRPTTFSYLRTLRDRWTLTYAAAGDGKRPLSWLVDDADGVYSRRTFASSVPATDVTLARDALVAIRPAADPAGAGTLVLQPLGGTGFASDVGPATTSAGVDSDEAGTTAAYIDGAGHVQLLDLSGVPAPLTAPIDTTAPNAPRPRVSATLVAGPTTIHASLEKATDRATPPFVAVGGGQSELRFEQAPTGSPDGPWSSPAVTTTLDVSAGRGVTTCFEGRATDAAGNVSEWSDPVCVAVDGTAPVVTATSAPALVGAKASFGYAATDDLAVASYDVRYRLQLKGAKSYGAWKYPTAMQATTSTKASVTLPLSDHVCWSVRARDMTGNTSAWSADRCSLVDDTAPRITSTSVPRWRGAPASGKVTSTFRYAATDNRGVASYDVRVLTSTATTDTAGWVVVASKTTKRSYTHTLRSGQEACYEVRARDALGNVGKWSARKCTNVAALVTKKPFEAEKLGRIGTSKVAVLQNYTSTHAWQETSADVFDTWEDRGIRLQVRTCPACGDLRVEASDGKVHTIHTKSSKAGWKWVNLTWKKPSGGYIFFWENTTYPRNPKTHSYIRAWAFLRHSV